MQVENDQERYFSNGRLVEVVHPCNCKRQENRAFHCIHNIDDFYQSLLSCSLFIYHLASGIYSNYLLSGRAKNAGLERAARTVFTQLRHTAS